MKDVLEGARGLARNPLGIIALFVAFVYGLAALVLGMSVQHLQGAERLLLVGFVVAFPVLVLAVFGILVVWHHNKLYGPGDYRTDESFLKTLSPIEREVRLQVKASRIEDVEGPDASTQPSQSHPPIALEAKAIPPSTQVGTPTAAPFQAQSTLGARVRDVASLGLVVVGRRLNLPVQPDVAIGAAHSVPFDGGYATDAEYLVVEVKYLSRPWASLRQITEIVDRVLAAEGRVRRLGDSRQFVLYLLLVVEEGTTEQIAAIRAKAEKVLDQAGLQHEYDVLTLQQLRAEALGNAA